MTAFQYRVPAAVLAVLFTTTAASAQVSAQQVWDSWKTQMGMYGENGVTIGGEDLVDGVLTVTDLTIAMSDDTGSMSGTLDSITFTEMGDGTVAVEMAESFPFAVTTDGGMGTTTAMTIAVTQTDLALLVSGTPEAMSYDVSATRYAVQVSDLVTNGTPTPGSMVFGLNDMEGTYATAGNADPMSLTYEIDVGSVDIMLDLIDPETGSDMDLTSKINDLSMTADGLIPAGSMAMAAIEGAEGYPPGLEMEASYAFGASSYQFTVTEDGMVTSGSGDVASGSLDLSLDESAIAIEMLNSGMVVSLASAMMPFPVTVSLAEYGVNFEMPLAQSDIPADFALGLNLTDVTVNEEIWAMLDPGAILARDPATAIIDLTGTMTVLANLMDPAAQEQMTMMGTPPALPNSMDLNALTLRFGGAELTGSGALTFDATDMETYAGMPKPVGTIDLAINGANGLMDKLVRMGLIPEDQIMMGRMMLGMFAVPAGDDMLTSTIEFTAEGGIMANGQQIR